MGGRYIEVLPSTLEQMESASERSKSAHGRSHSYDFMHNPILAMAGSNSNIPASADWKPSSFKPTSASFIPAQHPPAQHPPALQPSRQTTQSPAITLNIAAPVFVPSSAAVASASTELLQPTMSQNPRRSHARSSSDVTNIASYYQQPGLHIAYPVAPTPIPASAAVVRMRGIPFQAEDGDIYAFFAAFHIKPVSRLNSVRQWIHNTARPTLHD